MRWEARRKGFNHEELVCTQGNGTHKSITRSDRAMFVFYEFPSACSEEEEVGVGGW